MPSTSSAQAALWKAVTPFDMETGTKNNIKDTCSHTPNQAELIYTIDQSASTDK